uniref:Uncharacterized protein n=1 Tax=Paramormyrops kingsleyae TaxID=1676925 RepID=A0A3B3RSN5_9TELE
MDQCVNVERELEKVLQNFSSYGQHCDKVLQELVDYTSGLKDEIVQAVLQANKRHGAETGRAP